jgi:hypothetical protein
MATHPHGGATQTRLDRLLAYHESAAEAIRTTIGLLNGSAKAAKTNGHNTVLAEALALDGDRAHKVKAKARAKKKKPHRPTGRDAIRVQRQRTAQVLDKFDLKTPRPVAEVAQELGVSSKRAGFSPLINHGYLKKKDDGYVRTAKPYVVDIFAAEA